MLLMRMNHGGHGDARFIRSGGLPSRGAQAKMQAPTHRDADDPTRSERMNPDTVLSRRDFLGAAALGAAAALRSRAEGVDDDAAADPLVYVGTYTDDGRSRGIYRFRMHAGSGTLRPDGAAAAATNPSFLA